MGNARSLSGFVMLLSTFVPVSAQWLSYPTPGIHRTPDGKPNLTGPGLVLLVFEQLRIPTPYTQSNDSGASIFGHMEFQIMIDDPKAYTKPWTVTIPFPFGAQTQVWSHRLANAADESVS